MKYEHLPPFEMVKLVSCGLLMLTWYFPAFHQVEKGFTVFLLFLLLALTVGRCSVHCHFKWLPLQQRLFKMIIKSSVPGSHHNTVSSRLCHPSALHNLLPSSVKKKKKSGILQTQRMALNLNLTNLFWDYLEFISSSVPKGLCDRSK